MINAASQSTEVPSPLPVDDVALTAEPERKRGWPKGRPRKLPAAQQQPQSLKYPAPNPGDVAQIAAALESGCASIAAQRGEHWVMPPETAKAIAAPVAQLLPTTAPNPWVALAFATLPWAMGVGMGELRLRRERAAAATRQTEQE